MSFEGECLNKIKDLVKSDQFKKEVIDLNKYFMNRKQETMIQNVMVKILRDKGIEAFTEYPGTTDLSIIKNGQVYEVELKFQYSGDYHTEKACKKRMREALTDILKSDLFIVFVMNYEKLINGNNKGPYNCQDKFIKYATKNLKNGLIEFKPRNPYAELKINIIPDIYELNGFELIHQNRIEYQDSRKTTLDILFIRRNRRNQELV